MMSRTEHMTTNALYFHGASYNYDADPEKIVENFQRFEWRNKFFVYHMLTQSKL